MYHEHTKAAKDFAREWYARPESGQEEGILALLVADLLQGVCDNELRKQREHMRDDGLALHLDERLGDRVPRPAKTLTKARHGDHELEVHAPPSPSPPRSKACR